MKETDEDRVIGQIILSLGHYSLNNVKANLERPIAAIILGCCLIDQMASFRYKERGQWETFVGKYMKMYKSMELYDSLRNKLVHNYSLDGYYKIGFGEKGEDLPYNIIYADDFVANLELAFDEFSVDIRTDKDARNNAIEWNRNNKILAHAEYSVTIYSGDDSDYLIKYYSAKIGKPLNKSQTLTLKELTKHPENNGMYSIRGWVTERPGLWLTIEDLAKYRQYQSPQTVLKLRDSR